MCFFAAWKNKKICPVAKPIPFQTKKRKQTRILFNSAHERTVWLVFSEQNPFSLPRGSWLWLLFQQREVQFCLPNRGISFRETRGAEPTPAVRQCGENWIPDVTINTYPIGSVYLFAF